MKEPSKAKSQKVSEEETSGITYREAVEELEQILEGIENGETDIDLLSEKMKRAVWLVRVCRAKLRNTDDEVKKIIKDFGDGES